MEEARKVVEELNDEMYGQGLEDIGPFEYRSRGWQNSVITFMGEIIWAEEDDPREWIEDKFEDLHQFLWKEAKGILNRVSGAMDSGKLASDYLIRMLKAVPDSIDIKYEIDDYGVHYVEVSNEDYVFGIIEEVFEERFPDQELLILTKESLNRVTKPIWSNKREDRLRANREKSEPAGFQEGLVYSTKEGLICRTGELSGYGFDSRLNFRSGDWAFTGCREADGQERDIFKHNLIQELKSRGFTRGVKFRSTNELHDVIYDPREVKFDSEGIHIGGMYIMKHGEWCTILDTKDEYTRGQEDLIARLKDEFTRILEDENNKGDMLLVEIIGMLRNLKAEDDRARR